MHSRLDHLSRLLRRGDQGEGQPQCAGQRLVRHRLSCPLRSRLHRARFLESLWAVHPGDVGRRGVRLHRRRSADADRGRHVRNRTHRADHLGRGVARDRARDHRQRLRLHHRGDHADLRADGRVPHRQRQFPAGHRRAHRGVRRVRPRLGDLGPRLVPGDLLEGVAARPEHPSVRAGRGVHPQRRARSLHPALGLAAERTGRVGPGETPPADRGAGHRHGHPRLPPLRDPGRLHGRRRIGDGGRTALRAPGPTTTRRRPRNSSPLPSSG